MWLLGSVWLATSAAAAEDMESVIHAFVAIGGAAAIGSPILATGDTRDRPVNGLMHFDIFHYNLAPSALVMGSNIGAYTPFADWFGWEGRSYALVRSGFQEWSIGGNALFQATPTSWRGSVELLAGGVFRPYGASEADYLPTSWSVAGGPNAGVRVGAHILWITGRAEATMAGLFGTEWSGVRQVLETELAVEIHPWSKPEHFTASLGLAWKTHTPLGSAVAVLPPTHQFGLGLTLGVPPVQKR